MKRVSAFARMELILSSVVVAIALLVSAFTPFDRATWVMEVAPVVLAYPILWWLAGRQGFYFSRLVVWVIALHALVLILGGAYSYARVPLGFWMQDLIGGTRNPYDKIGHFMQGFVPALVTREWVWRRAWVSSWRVAGVFAVAMAMMISAVYELIEWLAAELLGQGADEFLGTQGYVWDTQSDMLFALIGSVVAVVILQVWHKASLSTRTSVSSIDN